MATYILLLLFAGAFSTCEMAIYDVIAEPAEAYELPDLPYQYTGLEPDIDGQTLEVHHQGHHRSYTDKMNSALAEWREEEPSNDFARSSILEILRNVDQIPDRWQTAIKNNGGGYVNHIIYWATMCPAPEAISSNLKSAIDRSFGCFENFKEQFTSTAKSLFGSGYVWLCEDDNGRLFILTSANQDSPVSKGLYPILVIDIWEHAYYLKHQYRRPDYVTSWWNVACWQEVEKLQEFWHSDGSKVQLQQTWQPHM